MKLYFKIETDDRQLYHHCVEKFSSMESLYLEIGGLKYLTLVDGVKFTSTLAPNSVSVYPFEITLFGELVK